MRSARTIADVDAALRGRRRRPRSCTWRAPRRSTPELEALELWYAAGLRSLGPVWSRRQRVRHGVRFAAPSSPGHRPGAQRARRGAGRGLRRARHRRRPQPPQRSRLLGRRRGSKPAPLVASHSGAHAICPSSRNLTDAQLEAIGASGGLVGIVFATAFLRPDFADDPDTPLALIAEHARHVADLIGVEHVALGSDFDGATVPGAARRRRRPAALVDALAGRLLRGRARRDLLGQLAPRPRRLLALTAAVPDGGRRWLHCSAMLNSGRQIVAADLVVAGKIGTVLVSTVVA